MEQIADRQIYVQRMAATLADKCWWVDHLPPEIDTVVDYGCAEGDLGLYLAQAYPGRFKYIGVDTNGDMIAAARQKVPGKFYTYIGEVNRGDIDRTIDPDRTILVLSSVIHEILSYLSTFERIDLWKDLRKLNCRYVAIRDMYGYYEDIKQLCGQNDGYYEKCVSAIEQSPYTDLWKDMISLHTVHSHTDPAAQLVEFLLKYRYKENWEREKKERYLWNWMESISGGFPDYDVVHDEQFGIPFIQQQVKKDLGLDFPINTHRKVLLERHKGKKKGESEYVSR